MSPKWEACRGITMFIVIFLLFLNAWRLYSNNQIIRNDGSWNGNDMSNCLEFKQNPLTDRLECHKRRGSRSETLIWVCFVFFLFWIAWFVIIILKNFYSRVQQWRKDLTHQSPGIPKSFYNTPSTNLSATHVPAHLIALPPTTTKADDDLPPEYVPPPVYNVV